MDPFQIINSFLGEDTSSNKNSNSGKEKSANSSSSSSSTAASSDVATVAAKSARAALSMQNDKGDVKFIIFSKDRAFQLRECLRTLHTCVIDPLLRNDVKGLYRISVNIIWTASTGDFERCYKILKQKLSIESNPLSSLGIQVEYNFFHESDFKFQGAATSLNKNGFERALEKVLGLKEQQDDIKEGEDKDAGDDDSNSNRGESYVYFGVDDSIYYREIDICNAIQILRQRKDVFSFHVKLCPAITHCHPAGNVEMKAPKNSSKISMNKSLSFDDDIMIFKREEGSFDWNYPWDLCGTLYRYNDVNEMIRWITKMKKETGYKNPNYLEANGEFISKSLPHIFTKMMPFSACFASPYPCMSVITVNRVQSTYSTPIFTTSSSALQYTVENLNDLFLENNLRIDTDLLIESSRAGKYKSVHIGDLNLKSDDNHVLSVIMPVFNGEKYLKDAITSILEQNLPSDMALELLVIIDPKTTDNSADIVKEIQVDIRKSGKKHTVDIIDAIPKGSKDKSETKGISSLLNMAWRKSKGKYVARMDADDISVQGRFLKQIIFLIKNQDVGVVGTTIRIIAENDKYDDCFQGKNLSSKVIMYPEDPLWDMAFRCAIAHPSVMIRKEVLKDMKGYDENQYFVEDYDLWTRILSSSNWKIRNINEPLLCLRKHESNTSKAGLLQRQKETARIALANLFQHLGTTDGKRIQLSETVIYSIQRGAEHLPKSSWEINSAFTLIETIALVLIKHYEKSMAEMKSKGHHDEEREKKLKDIISEIKKDSRHRLMEIMTRAIQISTSQNEIVQRYLHFQALLTLVSSPS